MNKTALKNEAKAILSTKGITRYCVLSLRGGKEHTTPWFNNHDNAVTALNIVKSKGYKAVIYRD